MCYVRNFFFLFIIQMQSHSLRTDRIYEPFIESILQISHNTLWLMEASYCNTFSNEIRMVCFYNTSTNISYVKNLLKFHS